MSSPFINITIPVFNEERQLAESVCKLHRFLAEHCQFRFEIVIANNGSTDRTQEVAEQLCRAQSVGRVVCLQEKGRGRAVKRTWTEATADVLSYMDVDLSTGLDAFSPMIRALTSGEFDLAIGSRLRAGSITKRSLHREVISRCYNRLVRFAFSTNFSDAQCGFKAITKEAAQRLLPVIEDNGWFFDTELLAIAEKSGYRIFDMPVQWTEDPDSRVKIISTAWADVQGIIRVRRSLRSGKYASSRR